MWLPIGIGLLVALATAISDVLHPAAAARGLNELHIRGPAAIPFYLYGAVLLTVVFHFLPVAAGAWVARRAGLRARRAVLALTVLAVGFSEDLTFFTKPDDGQVIETARHVLSVLANSSEALLILRFGLLAGLLQRGSTYLVWHLVWPAIA